MLSLILFLPTGLVLVYLISVYRSFNRNLAAAKQSGIPYVTLPVYTFNRLWLLTHPLWLPFMRWIPGSSNWINFVDPAFHWQERYDSFRRLNSDIFLLVSPGANYLHVADADVITQIVTRRNDFPKPIAIYKSLDIYGKNLVTTEGSIWRHHRKITSPPFSEKNNHLVWTESLYQAQSMLVGWTGRDGNDERTIWSTADDAMRLSLHVISRAGFGVRLEWPHEEKGNAEAPPGHALTYQEALGRLLDHLLWVVIAPRWFLKYSPFQVHRIAYDALVEWTKYMHEMFAAKRVEISKGETTEGLDIMGTLIRGAGYTEDDPTPSEKTNFHAGTGSAQGNKLLSDDEILGNAWVFVVAGHETTANSIHFALLYLAMNPHSQRRLQHDIDKVFGDRPISEWDYETDCPKLFNNMVCAVLNEELRLIPPAIGIPKSTPHGKPQSLNFNGRKVVVPGGTHVVLSTAATHRNPKYWPSIAPRPRYAPQNTSISKDSISKPTLISSTYKGPTVPLPATVSQDHPSSYSSSDPPNDLEEFKPERWFVDSDATHSPADTDVVASDEDVDGPDDRTINSQLWRPPRSAFIPFSEGPRSCLGRRFAQVEVLAVLAVIFREYSVELAVDEWASDAEVDAMPVGGEERRRVWGLAEQKALWLLQHGMVTVITIQMKKGKVPLRLARRGRERFAFDKE